MAIRLLDEHLINKIAAGEVVERPASVVKELVENSLDAGARRIEVHITGGGIDNIEVVDDGEGIMETDLPMAFLRHATSKIDQEEDLYQVKTLGFRGEALPSIASVSRLEIYTRHLPETGMMVRLEGGQLQEKLSMAGARGTRIVIRDLFYNTPARRKFLRKPVTEGNHVYELLCRYAMARPEVSFSFSNHQRSFFKTPGQGRLDEVLITLWGGDLLSYLLPVDSTRGSYSLQGFVSGSQMRRLNRKNQLFFVNRRPVRSPILYRALDMAYKGILLTREQPLAILNLNLPEEEVDVNVHPQKNEVRFRDERQVFQILLEGISQVLDGTIPRGEMLAETERRLEARQEDNGEAFFPKTYQQGGIPFAFARGDTVRESRPQSDFPLVLKSGEEEQTEAQETRIIGQVLDAYILMEKDEALWLVDQHAAHERVMYWKFTSRQSANPSQILAIPLAVEFSSHQVETMENNLEEIEKLGFVLSPLGPNSMLIRQAPMLVKGKEIDVLLELADMIETEAVQIGQKALIMMACKQAVKAGSALSMAEMTNLVKELFSVPDYRYCPHGRPTMIKLSRSELDRMFKR
ncbi:MAG TPA: DNA mismatch repair endonuclease MutL [Syntrophomonadaceae bacterium]|nr:DNA mismatch repair endonuclease MutL [Syntrophomonadaceae bacterium]